MGVVDGKVALVTGGANGIGRGIANALAAEGASVVVNDLGGAWDGAGADDRAASVAAEEIGAAGGKAVADHGDVSDPAAAAAMVKQAVENFGSIDIVVNTAGILRDKMLVSMEQADWDAVIKVHLTGHYNVTQAAAQFWRHKSKETGAPAGGRVVNFASEAGYYGNLGQANYAAAKGGIVSFTLTASRELEKYGVTCNVIAPRARTRLTEGTFGESFPTGEHYDQWDPSNVAPVVLFLASEEGGNYTSQALVAGGGVIKLIDPYTVIAEVKNELHPPTVEEVGAFFKEVRGESAPVPPFPLMEEVMAMVAAAK